MLANKKGMTTPIRGKRSKLILIIRENNMHLLLKLK